MADGLVSEIQRDALDPSVKVSTLLRKVRLAAAKLNLTAVEGWVEQELKGYPDEAPEYRQTRGQVRYWNPYHGWQPVAGDAKLMDILSSVTIGESIGSLETLLDAQDDSGSFHVAYTPHKLQVFSEMFNQTISRAGVQISVGTVAHVMETVRNLVLDWAISLEKAGVTGANLSFSPEEKQLAQASNVAIHIASIGTFTGNLGAGNSSGNITSAPLNIEKVRNLVTQIKSQSENLANEGVEATALTSVLEKIETHLSTPNESLLRSALGELRSIITEAAGGIVSTGALALLHQILGTGVPG